MTRNETILVVDDEDYVRESLVEILESEGFATLTARSKAEALKRLGAEAVSVVVTDLRMPRGDGLSLLESVRREEPDLPVILLTGVGTIRDAVQAMKAGAFDFVEKPVEPDQFVHVVERAIEHRALRAEVAYLRETIDVLRGSSAMVGSSDAIERVRALIAQVAETDATVLVTGESGTGKELVASEIHRASSRSRHNFVRVNCAAVTETLFESEFFGHRRGAFTGAIADRDGRFAEAEGGTLVLDEIGTLRPEMQAKLLRVLETGEYQVVGESRTRHADVRVVAMTNEGLEKRVREGTFRPDLYYRLQVFPIELPPLRARKGDIAELSAYFLSRFARERAGRGGDPGAGTTLSPEALAVLDTYDWPGNIRELRNVLERARILARGAVPDGALFGTILQVGRGTRAGAPRRSGRDDDDDDDDDLQLRRRIDALERRLIARALERAGGRKAEAAKLLGIDPKNLSYYLKKHAGEVPSEGEEP